MLAAVANDDPLIAVVRLQRADLTEQLGHTEEAMHELQSIAHDYPDSPIPAMREGDLLRGKQRFAEAIAAYDRAIARIKTPAPTDWLVYYDRGICYERSHQWTKAEADFKHALKLSPDQPFVLNYLGYSWADMGQNLTQAREMIEKAVQRRPNDGAIVDSLGWVMLRQGQVADAVNTLERAVELEPEDASINGHLGDAYWAAGRKLEATYQWRRALTFNPEPDDAAKLEAKLQGGPATDRGQRPVGFVPDRLTEAAPAKVNLYLHVTGRRDDGYHLLDSLVAFAEIGDVLRADAGGDAVAACDGPVRRGAGRRAGQSGAARGAGPGGGSRRAGGARIVLEKHLPVASGIGGGSADAAAALRLLCRLWGLAPTALCCDGWRRGLARTCRPAWPAARARMSGIGERLEPAPALPPCGIVLVNPGMAVATADVFRARRGTWSAAGGAARRLGRNAQRWPPIWRRCATTWSRPPSRCGPVDRRRPRGIGGDAGLPAGAHERLRRDLLRPVRRSRRRPARRWSCCSGPAGGAGPVRCGKRLSRALRRAARDLCTQRRMGRRQGVRQRILIPPSEVRILPPQPDLTFRRISHIPRLLPGGDGSGFCQQIKRLAEGGDHFAVLPRAVR